MTHFYFAPFHFFYYYSIKNLILSPKVIFDYHNILNFHPFLFFLSSWFGIEHSIYLNIGSSSIMFQFILTISSISIVNFIICLYLNNENNLNFFAKWNLFNIVELQKHWMHFCDDIKAKDALFIWKKEKKRKTKQNNI